MTPYFRGVRMISDEMIQAGNGSFIPFSPSAGLLESYGVRCADKYFVYLLNNCDTVVTTPVIFPVADAGSVRLQSFAPESLSFTQVGDFTFEHNTVTATITLGSKKELVLIVGR